MDNDGKTEFFVRASDQTVKAYDFSGGTVTQKWSTVAGNPVLVGNMDSDAANEILLVADGVAGIYDSGLGSPLASLQLASVPGTTPVAADLDQNGSMDVIMAGPTKVRRYEATGSGLSLLWTIDGFGSNRGEGAVLQNMDGDAAIEILIGTADGNGESRLSVRRPDGTEKWGKSFSGFTNNSESGIYQWMPGDFNGDGTQDVAVFLQSGGWNTERTKVVDGAGAHNILWSKDSMNHSGVITAFGPIPGYGTVADTDQDGKDDILMIAKNFLEIYDGAGNELLDRQSDHPWVNSNGTPKTNWHFVYDTPVWIDANNDGVEDIVPSGGLYSISVLEADTGDSIWATGVQQYEFSGRFFGIADIDEDGNKEIVVSRWNGDIESRDGDSGALEWTYRIGDDTIARSILTADVDQDGRAEIIVGTNDGRLIALNGGTDNQLAAWKEPRVLWEKHFGNAVGSPIFADMDNDGYGEILVAVGDGYLYCLDSQPIEEATWFVDDHFDSETDGLLPAGWNENNSSYGDFTIDSGIYYGGSGKSAKFLDSTNNYFTYKTFADQRGRLIAEWAARPAQTNQTVRMQLADGTSTIDNGTWGPLLYFYSDGQLKYNDGSGYHNVMSYSANTWYTFRLEADIASNRYDLYVNGVLAGSDLPFYRNINKITSIGFFGFNADTPTLYVDDVEVYKYTDVQILVDDRFDSGTNGTLPAGWNENNSAYGDYVIDNSVYYGGSGKSAKFLDNTSNNYFAYHTFTDQTGRLIAEWAARPAQTKQTARMQLADGVSTVNDGTWGPLLYFFSDGQLKYNDGSYHNVMSYSANTWYTFRLEIDVVSDSYNLYVNGELKGSNLKFYNAVDLDRITSLGFFGFGADTPTLHVDDVRVYKYDQTLLDESFNYYHAGNLPPKWFINNGASGTLAITDTVYKGSRGKSLKFTDNGNPGPNYEVYTPFVPHTEGKVEIAYDVRLAANNKTAYVFSSGTGGYWRTPLYFAADGNLKYYAGGSWQTAMSYAANRWYRVKITADVAAQTFDLEVDGVSRATGVPFYQTGGTDIRYFAVNTATQDGSTVYIDNLKVTKR